MLQASTTEKYHQCSMLSSPSLCYFFRSIGTSVTLRQKLLTRYSNSYGKRLDKHIKAMSIMYQRIKTTRETQNYAVYHHKHFKLSLGRAHAGFFWYWFIVYLYQFPLLWSMNFVLNQYPYFHVFYLLFPFQQYLNWKLKKV